MSVREFWNGFRRLIPRVGRTAGDVARIVGRNRALDSTFEQAAVAFAELGFDGRWIRVNRKFCEFLGYGSEEIAGLTIEKFTHPEELHVDLDQGRRMLAGEIDTYSREKRYLRKDGEIVWGSLTRSLVRDDKGNPLYFLAVIVDINEKKRAEEKLRESEASLRRLADSMPQIVWTALPDGSLDYYNERWFSYTGMALEQTRGWGWKPVLHSDDLQNCLDRWNAALASGDPYEVEYRLRRASDGAYRWHLGRAQPVRDAQGRVTKWFGTCTDIHDQKMALAKILESEARTNAIISNAAVILWSVDRTGTVTYSKGKGLEAIGMKADERVGTNAFALYSDDPTVPNAIRAALAGRSSKVLTQRLGRWFEILCAPLPSEKGEIVGVAGASFDVTDRVEIDKALRESQSRLDTVISHAPVVLWATDREGIFTLSEGLGLALLGLERGEVVGRSAFEMYREYPDIISHLRRVLAGETVVSEVKVGDVWFDSFFSPLRDTEGTICGIVGLATDITARKCADAQKSDALAREKAALEASELKSRFLANMSHEIRTPLNGVLGLTRLLLESGATVEQRRLLQMVLSSGESLMTIINDILDFSKIEAGKLTIEDVDFSVVTLVSELAGTLKHASEMKGIALIVGGTGGVPGRLCGDPHRIRQVLTNLLGNAIKFTHQGAVELQVSWSLHSENTGRLRVEVRDTGIGVPLSAQAAIFGAFSQVDASMSRRYGGTGLGLSISKRLVELMGGEIGFSSREGQGTTFWFSLPLRVARESCEEKTVEARTVGIPAEARVLLVEDNEINQILAMKLLERMGLNCDVVSSGVEALNRFSRTHYDLIIMDCQMPEMDGYEAARRIRETEGGSESKVPIVAVTAHAMRGDDQKCFEAGMSDYLTKPIDEERFRQTVSRWLPRGSLSAIGDCEVSFNVTGAVSPNLDRAALGRLGRLDSDGSRATLRAFVGRFLESTPGRLETLGVSVASCDRGATSRCLHDLKAVCGQLGLLELSTLIKRIERFVADGDFNGAGAVVGEFEPRFLEVRDALREYIS